MRGPPLTSNPTPELLYRTDWMEQGDIDLIVFFNDN